MKKDTKLIILLAVLVVCVVSYKIIGAINSKQEESKKTALFSINKSDITRLDWSYSGEEITIENSTGVWHWTGDEKFPVDQTAAENLAEKFAELSYSQEISKDNFDEYGFGEDSRVIIASDKDGNEYKVTVGGKIDLTSENYITVDGKDKVYAVGTSFSETFNKVLDDLLQKEQIERIDDYSSIKIIRGDEVLEITKNDNGKWAVGDTELDETKVGELANKFFNLRWEKCDSYNADDTKKSERGFDSPYATVALTSASDEVKLLFGKEESGMLYAKLDGSNMIYTVNSDIKESINTSIDDLIPDAEPEQTEEVTE